MNGGPTPKSGEMAIRMGGPTSVEMLAHQAAHAEGSLGVHGVSVYVRKPLGVKSLDYGVADVFVVRGEFPMHKTMGRGHYTVELPRPVTEGVANRFNNLFQWFNQGPQP